MIKILGAVKKKSGDETSLSALSFLGIIPDQGFSASSLVIGEN